MQLPIDDTKKTLMKGGITLTWQESGHEQQA